MQHQTNYHYVAEVLQSKNAARLLPSEFPEQRIVHHELKLTPQPTEMHHHPDYFGNPLSLFSIDSPHQELQVELKLWVLRNMTSLSHQDIDLQQALHIFQNQSHQLPSNCWACFPHSKGTPHIEALKSEFQNIFEQQTSLIAACRAVMTHIYKSFKFDAKFSQVDTPLETIYGARRGVCQDFSHIMLSGLRSLGVPCRYISGYLETLPPPGKAKLVGADASHAWVSVYIPNAGWMDFDPTNNMIPAQYHVSMASGRDFHDVSPMKGIFHGYAHSHLSISVDVSECPADQWPQPASADQQQQ